jgi:hypothetical protein
VSDEQQVKDEREALKDLLGSDGWALFVKAAQSAYGPDASLQRIDATLDVLDPGAVESEREAFRSIRAESRAVLALIEWPSQRLQDLEAKPKSGFLSRRRT